MSFDPICTAEIRALLTDAISCLMTIPCADAITRKRHDQGGMRFFAEVPVSPQYLPSMVPALSVSADQSFRSSGCEADPVYADDHLLYGCR